MMSNHAQYPSRPPAYWVPQPTPIQQHSAIGRAAFVGAVMGASRAAAGALKQEKTDSSVMGDVLAGMVTGGLATAGVVAVGERIGLRNSVTNTAVMFLAGTALLYTLQKPS